MQRISTKNLQTGMVLGEDVKDLSGRMLLKAGIEIEEKHLRILRTWGILGVTVRGEDGDIEAVEQAIELPEAVVEAIQKQLDERFLGIDVSSKVISVLVELARERLVKQYLMEQSGK